MPWSVLAVSPLHGLPPHALDALSSDPDLELFHAETDALVEEARALEPDVLVASTASLNGKGTRQLRRLRVAVPEVHVLVLMESKDARLSGRLLRSGARGFLVPGASPGEVVRSVRALLAGELVLPPALASGLASEFVRVDAEHRESSARLEFALESLHAQLAELQETHVGTVEALAGAVELRDEYTGGHIARVRAYSLALARMVEPSLASDEHASAYMLHDIGKLAIPDSVLLKAGALTDEEFEIIKHHTTAGAHYVEAIPFLRHMTPLVRSHHERWDGGGYPDGRAGTEIPLVARIFAVADTLDAMTTDRPYRRAQSFEVACEEIRRCSGTQFDPAVVEAFMVVAEKDEAFADLRAGVVPGRDHLPGPLIRAFRAADSHSEHRPA